MKYTKILLFLLLVFISPISFASFDKDLFYGIDNDSQVLELQEFLTSEGLYSGPITGNYYSLTVQAVKSFQERENIKPVAGYFGSLTREKANQILNTNLNNTEVQSTSNNQTSDSLNLQSQIDSLLLIIKSLQEELAKQQIPTQETLIQIQETNNIFTLPNGSIVELDSNGQIVRYIKEVTPVLEDIVVEKTKEEPVKWVRPPHEHIPANPKPTSNKCHAPGQLDIRVECD